MSPTGCPRVGVGLPVYNGERYLAGALDALLGQTWSDFILFIGDNASTDGTEDIARHYAARDSRVRYHRHRTNIGAPRNFNYLFEQSGTAYFRWQAADDLVLPEYTARCVEVLDSDPGAVLAYCGTIDIDGEGRELGPYEDRMHVTQASARERFRRVRQNLQRCNAVFGLLRSSVLRHTSLFQTFVHSDRVFLAELALHGKLIEVPERLFRRRYHPAASSAMNDRQRDAFYTGQAQRSVRPQYWPLLAGYYRALAQAPVRLRERLALHTDLLRTFVWWRGALSREAWEALRRSLGAPPASRGVGEPRAS